MAKTLSAIERGREVSPGTYVYVVEPTMTSRDERWFPGSGGARFKAVRSIGPGEIVRKHDVTKIMDVEYGQRLRAVIEKGAISLTMQAVASGSGAIGEVVPVRIVQTGKRIEAVILSEGEVYAGQVSQVLLPLATRVRKVAGFAG